MRRKILGHFLTFCWIFDAYNLKKNFFFAVAPQNDKPVGSIADYDPMAAEQQPAQPKAAGGAGAKAASGGAAAKGNGSGFTVKALYDYNASDKDEVCEIGLNFGEEKFFL